MRASSKLIGIASAVLFVSLAQAGLAAEPKARAEGQMLAMDDMKPMQPEPPAAGASQNMGPKSMMMDDKMKAPPSTSMQDQGKMGQPGAQGGMMMMMEKMMGGMSGMGTATGTTGMAPGTTGMATGTADVTERIEGRIAFLKAELQITDKQMPEWNVLVVVAQLRRIGRLVDHGRL